MEKQAEEKTPSGTGATSASSSRSCTRSPSSRGRFSPPSWSRRSSSIGKGRRPWRRGTSRMRVTPCARSRSSNGRLRGVRGDGSAQQRSTAPSLRRSPSTLRCQSTTRSVPLGLRRRGVHSPSRSSASNLEVVRVGNCGVELLFHEPIPDAQAPFRSQAGGFVWTVTPSITLEELTEIGRTGHRIRGFDISRRDRPGRGRYVLRRGEVVQTRPPRSTRARRGSRRVAGLRDIGAPEHLRCAARPRRTGRRAPFGAARAVARRTLESIRVTRRRKRRNAR